MLPADIDDALALVAEAGWNQVAADWQMMLACGAGFCIRDPAGRAIATSIALAYPAGGFGWIGMVLVHGPFRQRGLATALLGQAIDALQADGLVPMLDATPAGRKVYEALGFRPIEQISRWRGDGGASAPPAPTPLSADDVGDCIAADGAAFGAARPELVADLLQRPGAYALGLRQAGTWLVARAGRTATQIGPLVAKTPGAACRALDAALGSLHGPLLLDIPDTETALAALVAARGFHVERSFTRMGLTAGRLPARGQAMRVIAGPELG